MISFHRCYIYIYHECDCVKTVSYFLCCRKYHINVTRMWTLNVCLCITLNFLNLPVSHTNLFTVVKGELTVPEEALKVNTHTHIIPHTL